MDARIDDEMLVVGGGDVAAIPLSHVHEIDLEGPLALHLLLLDIAVDTAAMDPDVFLLDKLHFLVLPFPFRHFLGYRQRLVSMILYTRFDIIPEEQFFLESHLLLLRCGIGLVLVQFDGRINGIGRIKDFTHG